MSCFSVYMKLLVLLLHIRSKLAAKTVKHFMMHIFGKIHIVLLSRVTLSVHKTWHILIVIICMVCIILCLEFIIIVSFSMLS